MESCAILDEFLNGVTTYSVMSLDHGVDVPNSLEAFITVGANVVAGAARERDEYTGVTMNNCGTTTHGYKSGYLGKGVEYSIAPKGFPHTLGCHLSSYVISTHGELHDEFAVQ